MSIRTGPKISVLFTALVTVVACGGNASSNSSTAPTAGGPVTLETGAQPGMQAAAFYVADDQGFFAKHGIKIDYVQSNNPAQPLIAGDLQIAHAGADVAVLSAAQGRPTPILVPLQQRNMIRLVVRKDLDRPEFHSSYPKNVQGLPKGLVIGVTARGNGTDFFVQAIFQGAGKKEGTDYDEVVSGSGANMLAALQAKRIDAAALFPPFDAVAENNGYGVTVDDESKGQAPAGFERYANGVIANVDWMNSHAGLAKGIVDAIGEAMTWMHSASNQDRLIEIVARHTGITDTAALKKDLPTIVALSQPYISCPRLAEMAKILEDVKAITTAPACGSMEATKFAQPYPKNYQAP